jgi:hypothetical protein
VLVLLVARQQFVPRLRFITVAWPLAACGHCRSTLAGTVLPFPESSSAQGVVQQLPFGRQSLPQRPSVYSRCGGIMDPGLEANLDVDVDYESDWAMALFAASIQVDAPNSDSSILFSRINASHVLSRQCMMGTALYGLIVASQPELAGKITGMFLEAFWDTGDYASLATVIDDRAEMNAKIQEALEVLGAAEAARRSGASMNRDETVRRVQPLVQPESDEHRS